MKKAWLGSLLRPAHPDYSDIERCYRNRGSCFFQDSSSSRYTFGLTRSASRRKKS